MNAQNPLISVIVPVYKAERFLATCLDSLLSQTYTNTELILINDGSPDNSGQICEEYAARDSRIRVVHKENGGVSSARNLGLDNAKGEYIAFVDSDDAVAPTFLEDRYRNAISTGSDASICNFFLVKEGEPFSAPTDTDYELLTFPKTEGVRNAIVCKYYAGSCWSILFNRKLVEGVRFREDIQCAEDVLFVTEALLQADRICYSRKPLYFYVDHPASSLRVSFQTEHITLMDACYYMKKLVQEHGMEAELGPAVDARTISCALALIRKLEDDPQAQKIYARQMQKAVQKHLSLKSLKCLASVMQISAVLASIHHKLYIGAVKLRAKTKR